MVFFALQLVGKFCLLINIIALAHMYLIFIWRALVYRFFELVLVCCEFQLIKLILHVISS
jgi:hypothetical protein